MGNPKEILLKWIQRFNRQDAEALASLYAEDAVNYQTAAGPVKGRENILKMFQRSFERSRTCHSK